MTAEIVLTELLRVNVVASAAILLVLLLRPCMLRWLGARVIYWLWLVVPIAAGASFVPPHERVIIASPAAAVATTQEATDEASVLHAAAVRAAESFGASRAISLPPLANVLIVVWLLGTSALFARSIVSMRRLAVDPSVGPALVGVLRPRLLLPTDFEARFDAQERSLILAHEAFHRVSGHTVINGLVEVVRCTSWFNPFVHLAALRIRTDQELACDAAVVAARPTERRAYAQALLKTQVAPGFLRLGCTWTSPSAKRIGERIEMLGRPSLTSRAAVTGASSVAAIGLAFGYAAWAQQPERVVIQTARPKPVWTRTAEAPTGVQILSHALEGQRHDFFIDLAQKGDIELVFFGATATEMWWWPNRGRRVWDREFGSLKAANFGSQGTHPDSLVWRMQNGELDGYEAKLVVLSDERTPNQQVPRRSRFRDWHAGYAAVIEQIRARQPQAKVLILGTHPRGFTTLRDWREIMAANAEAFTGLIDNQTVFYADFGERFFRADGSYNGDLWGEGPSGAGAQEPLYELWAQELQPWLDRFVR